MPDSDFKSAKKTRNAGVKQRPPFTPERLRGLALHYVGRYATTRRRLSDYLKRKVRERGWEDGSGEQSGATIETLIDQIVDLGYVDDQAFAAARAASLSRKGYGSLRIRAALGAAGIEAEQARSLSTLNPEDALIAAFRFAKRKRIGPYARGVPDQKSHQRAFAAFLRAGHSVGHARTVLATSADALPVGDE